MVTSRPPPTPLLHGTPVVPGVAYGPALVVRGEVSPARRRRASTAAASADAEAALAAYDEAAAGRGRRFARKADSGLGRRRRGAHRERRAGPRQGAARRGPQAPAQPARTCSAAVHAGGRAVRRRLHQHGRPDGRAGHRPARHRAPGRRPPRRRARAGRPDARRRPRCCVAEDLAPADTAGLDPARSSRLVTERGGPTSHTAIIARQLGIPCVVGTAGAMAIARRHAACWSTARPARSRSTRTPTRRARRVEADRERRARRWPRWSGPGRDRRRHAGQDPGQRRRRRVGARAAAGGPVEGVGLFRTELCFLNRKDEPSVEEQADIYAEVLERLRRRPVRRGPHPRRRLGQAGRVRHPRGRGEPRPRRPRAAAVVRQPRPARAPARRHRRGGRARPAPRPG